MSYSGYVHRERWLISWKCPYCGTKASTVRFAPTVPCFTYSCHDRADLGDPHWYAVVLDSVCCMLCTKCEELKAVARYQPVE